MFALLVNRILHTCTDICVCAKHRQIHFRFVKRKSIKQKIVKKLSKPHHTNQINKYKIACIYSLHIHQYNVCVCSKWHIFIFMSENGLSNLLESMSQRQARSDQGQNARSLLFKNGRYQPKLDNQYPYTDRILQNTHLNIYAFHFYCYFSSVG